MLNTQVCNECNQEKNVMLFDKVLIGPYSVYAITCGECLEKYRSIDYSYIYLNPNYNKDSLTTEMLNLAFDENKSLAATQRLNEIGEIKWQHHEYLRKKKLMDLHHKKYKNDPQYKLKMNIRCQTRRLFKVANVIKDQSSVELLGVTIKEAKLRLMKTLPNGYTEKDFNEGKLHIDHIKPLSWFNLKDPKERKKASHITNLQLLPAKDNLKKGNRYSGKFREEIQE